MVVAFLVAVVIANLAVGTFGQAALPFTAFLLIPFDMVTRDVLHSRWEGSRVWVRMASLVATGAAFSAVFAPSMVAAASFAAFASAQSANAGVFAVARGLGRWRRMNLSNAAASVVDSVVFPLIAFGGLSVTLSIAQAASKFAGGLVISSLFVWFTNVDDHQVDRV